MSRVGGFEAKMGGFRAKIGLYHPPETPKNNRNPYRCMNKLFAYLEGPRSFLPEWIRESHRTRHLVYALPCGFLGGPLFVLGLALGMEFKDKSYGGDFDFLDILATCIGGLPGSILWVWALLMIL